MTLQRFVLPNIIKKLVQLATQERCQDKEFLKAELIPILGGG